MKASHPIAAILMLGTLGLSAQDQENTEAFDDPIEAAIHAFNTRDRSKPNEVTVVLEAPGSGEPVLVTGKRPKDDGIIELSDIPVVPDAAAEVPVEEPQPMHSGLVVRVERVKQGNGEIDPVKVRLRAPFPAKPLSKAPAGWQLVSSDEVPAFQQEVELTPGKTITLKIRPHLLVPDADGGRILAVDEPGFEASLGYQQSDTISSVLSDSILRLEEDSKQIGAAIDQLQQLLYSIPDTENASPEAEATSPAPAKP